MKQRRIYLVGAGMGTLLSLTGQAKQAIEESEFLFGAARLLAPYQELGRCAEPIYQAGKIAEYLDAHPDIRTAAVLLSGDIGFYSGAKQLADAFKNEEVVGIPGISSVQYFFAKLQLPWESVHLMSLHGREQNLLAALRRHPKIFLLTGTDHSVNEICGMLCRYGYGQAKIVVGENLSYPEERFLHGTAKEFARLETAPLSVMLIERAEDLEHPAVPGIDDREFIRGKVPMTKSEVRSVSISKLRLCRNDVVYDIGAGTGSVSVEAALIAEQGQVYAVEYQPEAVSLIRQNAEKFGCSNVHVVKGKAPEALEPLPPPTRVFIGGSSGRLQGIFRCLTEKTGFFRLVLNAVTLETLQEAVTYLEQFGFSDTEIVQVAVTDLKTVGKYHMMDAKNPVFIVKSVWNKKEEM